MMVGMTVDPMVLLKDKPRADPSAQLMAVPMAEP